MEDLGVALGGRTVFLTGQTGFKGSWLALWLADLGARVVGYALPPPTQPSNFEVSRVAERLYRHHVADVRDQASLSRAVREARPDLVIHMAAQSLVREGYLQPAATFDSNVMGTVHLLEAVRTLDGRCNVIVVTSDKCYENVEQIWGYRETDRMGGRDPYSASKGAAELVVRAYRDSFFPPEALASHGKKLASVRGGNVIGGGDWSKDRLLADLARALAAGEKGTLRNPRSTRPWQHVLDCLGGYLTLAARLGRDDGAWLCDGWNFGPNADADWEVERVAKAFCEAWTGGRYRSADAQPQPHEARALRLDSTKAQVRLGWRPRWSTREAVLRAASWYQRFYAGGESMQAVCLEQIRTFMAGA
jgi:CDP-glucose 4,6-dehydratase